MRSKKLWGVFTADFAANAFTYLGVLLALVVIYVFFAFGYFGEIIDESHKQFRPLVEIGVIVFFLGLAWLLRHRSGIPQTATALELIGVVLIPIMLAASLRDGCTPGYRPYCMPPDLDGPVRWAGYGAVGLIAAAIYYLFARRRRIYAYLVVPMIWVAIGAFGLYLEDGLRLISGGIRFGLDRFTADGISGAQLIAVLVAIGLSVMAAARVRETAFGRAVATPTVRAAVAVTPFVLVLAIVFAYNDAIGRGVAVPDLGDLAWPNVTATAIAAAIFAGAATAGYAWEDLGPRLRRDMALVLRVTAYLALAASWLLTAGFGLSPAWLGAGLVGYAAVVIAIDRHVGHHAAAAWIVRAAVLIGATLSLQQPDAALAAWGGLGAVAIGRSASGRLLEVTTPFLAPPADPAGRRLELWLPLLIATGAGAAPLAWPDATPFTLLGIAACFTLVRLVPVRLGELRSLAGVPAVTVAAGALGVEVFRQLVPAIIVAARALGGVKVFSQTADTGLAPYPLSLLLVGIAAVVAATTIPVPPRAAAVVGLAGAAAMISLREAFGTTPWETGWIDTSVLAAAGLALAAAALVPSLHRGRLVYGTIGHLLIAAAAVRSLSFEQTAILGLAVLAVAHVAEAASIEAGRACTFSGYAARAGGGAAAVEAIPTLVTLVTLAPLALLIGRRVPFVSEERPRFGPLLAGLSWFYAAAALQRRTRARNVAVGFAYAALAVAVAVSAPSVTAAVITTASAAGVSAILALRRDRPLASVPSWAFAVAALLLGAHRAGVAGSDLYLVLHVAAAALVAGAALINQLRGRQSPGLGSPWLVPPVFLETLLLPAALALAVADGGWLAWVAFSTAAIYAYLGWSVRAGGVAIVSAGSAAIGYAAILFDNNWAHPFDQPLSWMPFAAALIGLAAALPGNRRWRVLIDPAPGLVISGLSVAVMALVYSRPAGVLDLALVITAGLLASIAPIRREEPWLIAAGLTLVAAGLVAGDYWAPLATLTAAMITGYSADRKRGSGAAAPLQAMTIAGLGATFGLTGMWQQWTAADLAAISGIAALATLTAATALSVAESWPHRVRGWAIPLHLLGQGFVAVAYGAAAADLAPAVPVGVATLLALLESATFGIIGTVRQSRVAVAGAVAAAGTAYGMFATLQAWTANQIIGYTAVIGAAVLAVAAAGWIVPRLPRRVTLWQLPLLTVGQAAAVGVTTIAAVSLHPAAAAGVTAAVLGYEAFLAAGVGTARVTKEAVAGSALLAASAYGFVPQWLEWTSRDFVAATAAVAAAVAIGATLVTRLPHRSRTYLWIVPLHALTVAAVAAIVVKAASRSIDAQDMWILAAVAIGIGCHLALNAAAAPPAWQIRGAAVAAFLAGAELAVTAEAERGGVLLISTFSVACFGLVAAVAAGLLIRLRRRWRNELVVLGAGLELIAVIGTAVGYPPTGVEMGSVLVVAGAAIAAFGLLAPDLTAVEAAVVVWLVALLMLVSRRIALPVHAAAAFSSAVLLAVVEMDRYRRRKAGAPIPAALHYVEWVLMLAPITLAAADMFNSLWFGLVLSGEGALLTSWGAVTEVRRRALVGSASIVLAIVLAVVIPAMNGMHTGLTGATWLTIGAVAALLFIVAGSTIERRRHAIGRRLAHLGEILEHWE